MKIVTTLFLFLTLSGCAYLNNGDWPDTQVPAYGRDTYRVTVSPKGEKRESVSHYRSSPRRERAYFPNGRLGTRGTTTIIPTNEEIRRLERDLERQNEISRQTQNDLEDTRKILDQVRKRERLEK